MHSTLVQQGPGARTWALPIYTPQLRREWQFVLSGEKAWKANIRDSSYKFYILLEKDRFRTGWGAVKSCLKSLKILRLWTQPTKSSALGGLQIP